MFDLTSWSTERTNFLVDWRQHLYLLFGGRYALMKCSGDTIIIFLYWIRLYVEVLLMEADLLLKQLQVSVQKVLIDIGF